jgi:hypothetical protein
MLSFSDHLTEQKELETISKPLKELGYSKPYKGAHGHVSYISTDDPNEMVLIDVPGKEWHYLTRVNSSAPFVVRKIDKIGDDSLVKYLS